MSNSIGSYARELISQNPGMSNQDIRDKVLEKFTEAKTSIACIAWYKSNMKKTGYKAAESAPPPRTLEVIEEEIVEAKLKLESLKEEYEYKKIEQAEEIKRQFEYYKSLMEKTEEEQGQ